MKDRAMHAIGHSQTGPILGVITWIGVVRDGCSEMQGVRVEGQSYLRTGRDQTWECDIFVVRGFYRHHHQHTPGKPSEYYPDRDVIGKTVYLTPLLREGGINRWNAQVIFEPEFIEAARAEMTAALIERYTKRLAVYEKSVLMCMRKLQSLTDAPLFKSGDLVIADGWEGEWVIDEVLRIEGDEAREKPYHLRSLQREPATQGHYGTYPREAADGYARIWASGNELRPAA